MVANARSIEKRVVGRFIRDVLNSGRSITVSLKSGYDVNTGGALVASQDRNAILAEALAGDDAHLFVHDPGVPPIDDGSVDCLGWVYIVLGNDGWDVINDYTTNLEELGLLAGATAVADRYEEEEYA